MSRRSSREVAWAEKVTSTASGDTGARVTVAQPIEHKKRAVTSRRVFTREAYRTPEHAPKIRGNRG
jgi:hypothetical protein